MSRSFFYGFGSIVGKFSGVMMLPVYTQFLSPEDYGVAGLLVLFVSLLQLIFGAQMEAGVTYFYVNKNVGLQKLWSNVFVLSIVTSAVPTFIVYIFAERVSLFLFDTPSYVEAVKIFSFTILLGVLEVYGFQFLRLKDLYREYLAYSLLKVSVQVSSAIITVVFLEMGVLGVLLSSLVASLSGFLSSSIERVFAFRSVYLCFSLVKQLFIYCYPIWLTGFVALYISFIPAFAISRMSSLEDLGLFNLATNFSMLIGVFFWNPFFMYWQVERFKIYKEPHSREIFGRVYKGLLIISLMLIVGVALMGRWVIELMADEAFFKAYMVLLPLCIHEVFRYLTWYFNFSFLIAEKTKETLRNSIFKAVFMTVLSIFMIPKWGFIGAAWSLAISGFATFVYAYVRSKHYYDMGIGIFSSYLLLIVCLALVAFVEDYSRLNLDLSAAFFERLSICLALAFLAAAYSYKTILSSKSK